MVIIHIIFHISGAAFHHATAGVFGFTRLVSFICKYVNITAITVKMIFFVANKSIPKKK
jgi:hypothetical protein